MVSHCGRVQSKRSQQYFENVNVDNNNRDDDYEKILKIVPKNFDLILLDTIHEAKHVEKIIYKYYEFLKVNCCFFIDDTSWIPYLEKSEKNKFYAEINNYETFQTIIFCKTTI